MIRLNAPVEVNIELTARCNARCVHCFANAGEEMPNELSTEELLRLVHDLEKMKVFRILFSGGEPFMKKGFLQLLEYASNMNFELSIATNGTLIDKKIAKRLKEIKYKGSIEVSIEGGKEITHDFFVGMPGAFKKVIRALKNLKESKIQVIAYTTVTKFNLQEIPIIRKLLLDLGVRNWRILSLMPVGRGKNIFKADLSLRERKNLVEFIKKMKGKNDIWISYDLEGSPLLFEEGDLQPERWIGCRAGKTKCTVTSRGIVLPCDLLRNPMFYAGNIRKRPFKEIWLYSKLINFFRDFHVEMLKGVCENCSIREVCGGGCRAVAYSVYKDILAPDPRCFRTNNRGFNDCAS